jgi:hypothetical protein
MPAKKRDGNEDAFFMDDDRQLYVVADGRGGSKRPCCGDADFDHGFLKRLTK